MTTARKSQIVSNLKAPPAKMVTIEATIRVRISADSLEALDVVMYELKRSRMRFETMGGMFQTLPCALLRRDIRERWLAKVAKAKSSIFNRKAKNKKD